MSAETAVFAMAMSCGKIEPMCTIQMGNDDDISCFIIAGTIAGDCFIRNRKGGRNFKEDMLLSVSGRKGANRFRVELKSLPAQKAFDASSSFVTATLLWVHTVGMGLNYLQEVFDVEENV